tara:strand:+ start:398 stop:2557 length:2160 start_codon:yes stop_codon:yes gene_type:complete
MTLINPFGMSRYLQPRRAGMIAFKGGSSTTITGLGDDQFSTLQTGQSNIRSDITAQGDAVQTYADTLNLGQENIKNLIGEGSSGTGLYGQFSSQADLLSGLGDRINTGFTDLTGTVNTETANLAEGQSGLMTGQSGLVSNLSELQSGQDVGFNNMGARFDAVDTAGTNLQTTVDTGFQDQTAALANTNANINTRFDDAEGALATGVADTKSAITAAADETNTQLGAAREDLVGGQSDLTSDLSTMSENQDIYATTALENQAALQSGQDAFVSNFDEYVTRYSDDVSLANQFRTDLEEAQTNAFTALREDLTGYNQANADNAAGTQAAVTDLNQAISGGFSDVSVQDQIARKSQVDNLNGIRNLLQTTGQSLDATTRDQYTKLTAAFDAEGNLIRQGIDAQGNTVQRELDAQNAVIETRFDQFGNQIGQSRMDVGQMINTANQFLSGEISGVGDSIAAGFDLQTGTLNDQGQSLLQQAGANENIEQTIRSEFSTISSAFDSMGNLITQSVQDNGNTIQRQIDQNGNLITTQFDQTGGLINQSSYNIEESIDAASRALQAGQEGLSSNIAQTRSGLMAEQDDIRSQISTGFDMSNLTMDPEVLGLTEVISTMQDLDDGRRRDLADLSSAFNAQGQLIRSTIGENGTTTARAIDENGNLIMRAFSATGNELGSKVLNIYQQLEFLNNLNYLPGANTSMGNISPAVKYGLYNSGFMSPFTQTR